jgi:hypothetical protein
MNGVEEERIKGESMKKANWIHWGDEIGHGFCGLFYRDGVGIEERIGKFPCNLIRKPVNQRERERNN